MIIFYFIKLLVSYVLHMAVFEVLKLKIRSCIKIYKNFNETHFKDLKLFASLKSLGSWNGGKCTFV